MLDSSQACCKHTLCTIKGSIYTHKPFSCTVKTVIDNLSSEINCRYLETKVKYENPLKARTRPKLHVSYDGSPEYGRCCAKGR